MSKVEMLNCWMPTSGTCLVASFGLNQFEPRRNDVQCVFLGKCHPNRSSEDIPAFWRLTATIASCLSRTWPAGALVTHCYTPRFTGEFVKLAVGSIPVCLFDKPVGLLVNIPFCSWWKQPNPWCHPGTPFPEIRSGLALVGLGFTPKMLGNQSHSPSVNVMAWYGTIRIHKLTSHFLWYPQQFLFAY